MSHPDATPLAEARDKILSQLTPLGFRETIAVRQASKRYAAEELLSHYDLPPSDNAAVDGFGIHAAFLQHHPDHAFRIVASARAGRYRIVKSPIVTITDEFIQREAESSFCIA